MSRTPEEREAARLKREAKRHKKTGETSEQAAIAPVDPVRYDPEDFVTPPGEAEPTAMYDPPTEQVSVEEQAPPAIPEEPVYDEPVSAGERPMGVKRMGRPGRPSGGSDIAPKERGGVGGAYNRYKNKPRGIPKQSTGMKRKGPIVLLVFAVIILWFLISLFQPFKGDGSGNVAVTIPAGSTNGQIADILADEDVIGSSFFFGLRARMSGAELQSGDFRMKKDMSYGSAMDLLSGKTKPANETTKLLLPEGKSRRQLAPIVEEAGIPGNYLNASKRSPDLKPRSYGAPRNATLEGFLFPATYEIEPDTTARGLVKQQLATFKTNFDTVSMTKAKRKKLTEYDVLIIASMIELETAKERREVAGVIYNRLKAGIPLGIDASTRFAVNNFTGPLTQSQLASKSPYNTRNRQGLPPGPIANPGLASIKAAANPATIDATYYVVKPCGDGKHTFSTSQAEHDRNVAIYNAAREKNDGKEPSDSSSKGC